MSISLNIQNLYKKFGNQWVLKSLNLTVYPFEKIAILGANGSGKSTLLKIMAGFLYFDKGKLSWIKNDQELESPDFTFSSPYIDLFEHLTIEEHIEFHFNQKPTWNAIRTDEIIRLGNLDIHRKKQIKQLSSGIKQRFKNTLAIFTSAEVLFWMSPAPIWMKKILNFIKNW